jgi:hemolysin III
MHKAHRHHHDLTNVTAPVTPKDPEKFVLVDSDYPVVEEHQEESMMFPMWSLMLFYAVFLLMLGLPFKAILPGQPVIISTLFTVTLCYTAYEVWHAILHLPFERFWKPLTDGKSFGPMVRRIYNFHVMHHWRPSSNLAVVGFWGIAVWDYMFRTHCRPIRLVIDGAEVNYYDARMAKPLWPIAAIDKFQGRLYKWSRSVENALARIFLRRKA